jgi:hypothetical protein
MQKYKHRNVIFHFLIISVLPTFDTVLVVSRVLYYTARFLSKPRKQQLSVSVIII